MIDPLSIHIYISSTKHIAIYRPVFSAQLGKCRLLAASKRCHPTVYAYVQCCTVVIHTYSVNIYSFIYCPEAIMALILLSLPLLPHMYTLIHTQPSTQIFTNICVYINVYMCVCFLFKEYLQQKFKTTKIKKNQKRTSYL